MVVRTCTLNFTAYLSIFLSIHEQSAETKQQIRGKSFTRESHFNTVLDIYPMFVGPCHHNMARPQVVDGGTASDMEGSCE